MKISQKNPSGASSAFLVRKRSRQTWTRLPTACHNNFTKAPENFLQSQSSYTLYEDVRRH